MLHILHGRKHNVDNNGCSGHFVRTYNVQRWHWHLDMTLISDSCLTWIFVSETNFGKIIILDDHWICEKSSVWFLDVIETPKYRDLRVCGWVARSSTSAWQNIEKSIKSEVISLQGTKLRLIQSPMRLNQDSKVSRQVGDQNSLSFVYLTLMFLKTKWSFKVDESARTKRSVKQNRHECYEPNTSTSCTDFPKC